jgi:hypothetical protein
MIVQLHIPVAVSPEKGLPVSLDVWAADVKDLLKRTTSLVVRNRTTIPQSNIP